MGSKKRSKPFRAKWKPSINTLDVAVARMARLSQSTVEGLAASLERSMAELSTPERSAQSWQDLRLACVVSRRVERLGVVKGLSVILDEGYEALEAMRERCMASGVWRHCAPAEAEMRAVREMARMHSFQLTQLSTGEFEQVFLAARSDLATLPKIYLPAAQDSKAA